MRVARPTQNHMAQKNTLRGNVFVCEGDTTLSRSRDQPLGFQVGFLIGRSEALIPQGHWLVDGHSEWPEDSSGSG